MSTKVQISNLQQLHEYFKSQTYENTKSSNAETIKAISGNFIGYLLDILNDFNNSDQSNEEENLSDYVGHRLQHDLNINWQLANQFFWLLQLGLKQKY